MARAQEALENLARPLPYRGHFISIRASAGLVLAPIHGRTPQQILKNADLALFSAKTEGRFRTQLYEPAMTAAMELRTKRLNEMREALDEDRIEPFYQPKIDLQTKQIVGFEALARLHDPERGILSPSGFGPVFDDPELAVRIDEAISGKVIQQIAKWLRDGVDCGRVAVNFSFYTIRTAHMVRRLLTLLAQEGVPTERLEIEVPETVFTDGKSEGIGPILWQLHNAGLPVALDDFGTGYASLTHLKRFPVDVLKIDRSFVRNLENDAEDAAIVSAVIGLGRDLKLTIVAEGIDKPIQARTLAARGCQIGQGYLFAEPMPASAVPDFIKSGSWVANL